MRYNSLLFLPLTLDRCERWTSRPGRFTPDKHLRYPLNRRLVGPQGRSGRYGCRVAVNVTKSELCRKRANSSCIVCFSDLDIDIEDNGDGTFSIYYTVKDAGDYTLSVKFGGQPVPDGFYTFTVSADIWDLTHYHTGWAVAQLVGALRYKPKVCGLDSRWCHWNFHLHNSSGRAVTLESTQPLSPSGADFLEIWERQPPGTM